MGFFQANIWKHSIFKGVAQLFSTQHRSIKCLMVSETGVISLETLPVDVGYVWSEEHKAAWAVIQKLKMPMQGLDELVLPITERSYLPLDPMNRLSKEEKDKIEPLKNIARAKHAEVKSRITDENKKSLSQRLYTTVLSLSFVIVAIVLIIYFIKS
jgi:hypothetical protein